MDDLLNNVLGRLEQASESPSGYVARCPAHEDKHPSLSIKRGDDGRVLIHCHAGCTVNAVVAALGLTTADLFPKGIGRASPIVKRIWPSPQAFAEFLAQKEKGRVAGLWSYQRGSGTVALAVVRVDIADGKICRPLHPVAGGWRVGDPPGLLPIYCLPEVKAAIGAGTHIWIPEGEKCVEEFRRLGFVATTSAHGAEAARKSDWTSLAGADVVLNPDNDAAGERFIEDVAGILRPLNPPARLRVVRFADLPKGGDIIEFVASRRAAGLENATIQKDLRQLAEAAPAWTSETAAAPADPLTWDSPEPLGRFDLPAFPVDSVRRQLSPLWQFCEGVSKSYQVPVDLPGLLALTVGGAALAKRCEVHVRADWWEPLNLNVAVIMEPGERKSAVFREITAPLVAFEQDECERLAPEIERNRSDLRMLSAAVKRAEQDAATQKDTAKREEARKRVYELVEALRTMPVMASPRMQADDATPEALAKLLHEQGGRIAVLSPEGGVFEQMAGRYSDGMPNLDVYLKGHAGDDIRIDRVSRPPEFVRRPALTIGLAIQPEILRGLADRPGFRGRGVLARFLYSLPTSRVGYRLLNPESVPTAVSVAYGRMIRGALSLAPLINADGALTPHIIRPDSNALAELDSFRDELERYMRAGAELAGLRDWALKLPGAVVRIAGILHGLEHAPRGNPSQAPLSGETMAGAIAIGRYLIEHAKASFYEMGADHAVGLARRLIAWITLGDIRTFTRREAFRSLRSVIRQVGEVDGPLGLLTDHGYIQPLPVDRKGPGRTPSTPYAVNPAAYGHNGHNGQKPPDEVDFGQSVHSVHDSECAVHDLGTSPCADAVPRQPPHTEAPGPSLGVVMDEQLIADASAAEEILGETLPGINPTRRGPWQ